MTETSPFLFAKHHTQMQHYKFVMLSSKLSFPPNSVSLYAFPILSSGDVTVVIACHQVMMSGRKNKTELILQRSANLRQIVLRTVKADTLLSYWDWREFSIR
jgi:hypothetical protein